jgi:O-antigen ligase
MFPSNQELNMPTQKLLDERNLATALLIVGVGSLPFSRSLGAIAVGLLALNWLVRGQWLARLKAVYNKHLLFALCGYYLLLCLGALWSSNLEQVAIDLRIALPLAIVPLVLAATPAFNKRHIQLVGLGLAYACVAGLVLSLWYALRVYYITGLTKYFYYHLLVSPLDLHSIYFSWYVATALLFLAHYIISEWRRLRAGWRAAHITLFVFLLVGLVLLSSRSIVFTLIAIILGALFVWSVRRFKWYVGLGITVVAVAGILVFASLNKFLRHRYEQVIQSDFSMVYRNDYKESEVDITELTLRLCTWRFVGESLQGGKWLYGVGTGDAQQAIVKRMHAVCFFPIFYTHNPHNQYLQALLMVGIGGVLLVLAFMLIPLFQSWRHRQWPYLMWLLLTMTLFLTESVLIRTNGVLFFACITSLYGFQAMRATE